MQRGSAVSIHARARCSATRYRGVAAPWSFVPHRTRWRAVEIIPRDDGGRCQEEEDRERFWVSARRWWAKIASHSVCESFRNFNLAFQEKLHS